MKQEIREHQVSNIHFEIVDHAGFSSNQPSPQRSLGPSVYKTSFDVESAHFGLPSVTIRSNDAKRRRERKIRERRKWTQACLLRVLILIFPILYYEKIGKFVQTFLPQTIVFAPHIRGDYAFVRGIEDLSTEDITPWCFEGVTACQCSDPMVPTQGKGEWWLERHTMNQQLAQSDQALGVDVVFYGDSIIADWQDSFLHQNMPRDVEGTSTFFKSVFSKAEGGKYEGLPLGIAGDSTPILLWRLQNGELPANLNPSFFWILIGTTDLTSFRWCSPEIVLIGIIRNVEEILSQRPETQVVINGLLPRTFNDKGYVTKGGSVKPSVWEEIKAINAELERYATFRERVSYFETSLFFLDPEASDNKLQIDKDLMPDFLHPSPEGVKLWVQKIGDKLDSLSQAEGSPLIGGGK